MYLHKIYLSFLTWLCLVSKFRRETLVTSIERWWQHAPVRTNLLSCVWQRKVTDGELPFGAHLMEQTLDKKKCFDTDICSRQRADLSWTLQLLLSLCRHHCIWNTRATSHDPNESLLRCQSCYVSPAEFSEITLPSPTHFTCENLSGILCLKKSIFNK